MHRKSYQTERLLHEKIRSNTRCTDTIMSRHNSRLETRIGPFETIIGFGGQF